MDKCLVESVANCNDATLVGPFSCWKCSIILLTTESVNVPWMLHIWMNIVPNITCYYHIDLNIYISFRLRIITIYWEICLWKLFSGTSYIVIHWGIVAFRVTFCRLGRLRVNILGPKVLPLVVFVYFSHFTRKYYYLPAIISQVSMMRC